MTASFAREVVVDLRKRRVITSEVAHPNLWNLAAVADFCVRRLLTKPMLLINILTS